MNLVCIAFHHLENLEAIEKLEGLSGTEIKVLKQYREEYDTVPLVKS